MSTYALRAATGARLGGRIVLITGAAGGIGSAVSLACARQGATVLLLDKRQNGLDSTYDAIVAESLAEPVQIIEDLATIDATRADSLADQIEPVFGRLDAIVHAASEQAPLAPLEHYPPEVFARVLQAQVTGPWILTRALLPLLRHSETGRIVFTTGDAGRIPRAYFGATAVGWSGIDTLAGIFAEEFESNESIRVFAIDPGAVATATRTRWYPAENPERLAKPDEIADAWVYLISEESADFPGTRCALRDAELVSLDQIA